MIVPCASLLPRATPLTLNKVFLKVCMVTKATAVSGRSLHEMKREKCDVLRKSR